MGLKALQAEERSRRCSLLQEEVQGAAVSTQQLLLKLQQAEDRVRVRPRPASAVVWSRPVSTRFNIPPFQLLSVEKQQLEEDQLQAHSRLSSHKEATHLLQTELQDSRAQVQDQENTIQTLQTRLEEAQVCLKDLL